jgi:hypothetical protein
MMAKTLRQKYPAEKLYILVPKGNSGNFTYDGIELGGERVCYEIEDEIEQLKKRGQQIKRISFVGYSLGGLVARYAVGLLDSRGVFDEIKPVVGSIHSIYELWLRRLQNFSTFASPHLGVRTPLRGWHNHIWNVLGARMLSASGRQLFTIDKFRGTGKPLLEVLADPDSIFIKGLAKFERRTLYANIVNDRSAVYYTTGIAKQDPFVNLDKIKINYVEGYSDVILDPEHPVAPLDLEEPHGSIYERVLKSSQTTFGRLPFILAIVFLLPIGICAFTINAGIQSFRSTQRIKLYERGLAGIEPGNYRVPLLFSGMRDAVEGAFEGLNSSQSNEYLVEGTEEEAAQDSPSSPSHSRHSSSNDRPANSHARTSEKTEQLRPHDPPTLALAPYQFRMVQGLDSVGWHKYPVHIHKVRHSHAAIIVRSEKASFDEGRIVLRHWLDEEFII